MNDANGPYTHADSFSVGEVIGTLGDADKATTCSMLATKARYKESLVRGFATFEALKLALENGIIDKAVVPTAYPALHKWHMDVMLAATDFYFFTIPDLVVAIVGGTSRKREILYYPWATFELIETIRSCSFAVGVKVASNEFSASRTLSHTDIESAGCITNRVIAESEGLLVIEVLRPASDMGFMVFKRKDEERRKQSSVTNPAHTPVPPIENCEAAA